PISNPTYADSKCCVAPEVPIIDSKMTGKEAFDGLNPKCPEEIRKRQKIVKARYYSSDNSIHQGQLVIDGTLTTDHPIVRTFLRLGWFRKGDFWLFSQSTITS
nr:hypothetical protein [Spirochaetales bacterium]